MQIEFYVYEGFDNHQSLYLSVCQLIEKWYDKQLQIALVCQSQETLQLLDQLLWTFNDQSFIPHSTASSTINSPVVLCLGLIDLMQQVDVLVNLSHEAINTTIVKETLVEIVFPDPTMQQLARDRYKLYRDQGHQLKTIKIASK